MQKKLIALAVASLASGAAFAQTNVTMYGIADAGYVYSTGGDNDFSGIESGLLSGSRLGFRGEEALGNGLKAIFTLEYSLDITNNSGVGNAGSLNSRQQFVGLAGNWGTVALGRQYSPGYQAQVNNDPFGGALFSPVSFLTRDAGNSITANSASRWNNSATFTTANYGGFTGKAIYAWGEYSAGVGYTLGVAEGASDPDARRDNIWDDGAYGLGANYANGPLNIDAVWQSRQYRRTPWAAAPGGGVVSNVNGADTNEWYIGGSYDLKVVKLMASYQDQDDKNAPNNDNYTWSVGAQIPIGAFTVAASYAQTSFDQGSNINGVKGLNGSSDAFGLGAMYSLSKRTTLYAGYVWADNDNDSAAAAPVALTGAQGDSSNTFLAGVRHSF